MNNIPTFKKKHQEEIIPLMVKEFGYSSVMEVPRIEKISINAGLGEAIQNHKILESTVKELAQISGQKPIITRARKSIANFKVRQGMPIGCCVTLRGNRMYEFYERLVGAALPRVRDFRGVSPKGFDGHGNYTLGIKEQLIFPEIVYDQVDRLTGFSITIVMSAKSDEEAYFLLKAMGMPFRAKK